MSPMDIGELIKLFGLLFLTIGIVLFTGRLLISQIKYWSGEKEYLKEPEDLFNYEIKLRKEHEIQ